MTIVGRRLCGRGPRNDAEGDGDEHDPHEGHSFGRKQPFCYIAIMLTKEQITKAFARLGEILWQQRKRGEIAVFGGTAIVLEHDFRHATQDVDAKIEKEHGAVTEAQQQVARELGLPTSWLNEQATSYLSAQADFDLFDTYPDQARPGLVVYVATPQYLLAMKAQSLRIRDMADAVLLARKIGATSAEQISDLVSRFYPNERITERLRAHIAELVRQIHAPD